MAEKSLDSKLETMKQALQQIKDGTEKNIKKYNEYVDTIGDAVEVTEEQQEVLQDLMADVEEGIEDANTELKKQKELLKEEYKQGKLIEKNYVDMIKDVAKQNTEFKKLQTTIKTTSKDLKDNYEKSIERVDTKLGTSLKKWDGMKAKIGAVVGMGKALGSLLPTDELSKTTNLYEKALRQGNKFNAMTEKSLTDAAIFLKEMDAKNTKMFGAEKAGIALSGLMETSYAGLLDKLDKKVAGDRTGNELLGEAVDLTSALVLRGVEIGDVQTWVNELNTKYGKDLGVVNKYMKEVLSSTDRMGITTSNFMEGFKDVVGLSDTFATNQEKMLPEYTKMLERTLSLNGNNLKAAQETVKTFYEAAAGAKGDYGHAAISGKAMNAELQKMIELEAAGGDQWSKLLASLPADQAALVNAHKKDIELGKVGIKDTQALLSMLEQVPEVQKAIFDGTMKWLGGGTKIGKAQESIGKEIENEIKLRNLQAVSLGGKELDDAEKKKLATQKYADYVAKNFKVIREQAQAVGMNFANDHKGQQAALQFMLQKDKIVTEITDKESKAAAEKIEDLKAQGAAATGIGAVDKAKAEAEKRAEKLALEGKKAAMEAADALGAYVGMKDASFEIMSAWGKITGYYEKIGPVLSEMRGNAEALGMGTKGGGGGGGGGGFLSTALGSGVGAAGGAAVTGGGAAAAGSGLMALGATTVGAASAGAIGGAVLIGGAAGGAAGTAAYRGAGYVSEALGGKASTGEDVASWMLGAPVMAALKMAEVHSEHQAGKKERDLIKRSGGDTVADITAKAKEKGMSYEQYSIEKKKEEQKAKVMDPEILKAIEIAATAPMKEKAGETRVVVDKLSSIDANLDPKKRKEAASKAGGPAKKQSTVGSEVTFDTEIEISGQEANLKISNFKDTLGKLIQEYNKK